MTDTGRGELVIGVDIGGTKTAILICDANGEVLARHVAPTAVGAPEKAADAIASLVGAALDHAGANPDDVAALGVGVPGRVDRERGEVTLAVNLRWHALSLGPRLESRLGIPTVLENDVRAAALGLHRRKAFGDIDSLALLAIGTGISAGVVIDGRLHRGSQGLAGEIGHAVIDPSGPRCACGLTGCFEAIAAGPAIVNRAIAAWSAAPETGDIEKDARRDLRPLSAEAVFAAAAEGDQVAGEVIDSVSRAVAWGVHLLALAYDVERIVIGGGVSHAGEPFIAPVRRELERIRAASPLAREILVPGRVQLLPPGADAGAWGAVVVAREALARSTGRDERLVVRREVGHA